MRMSGTETLFSHPGGKCYGHLQWDEEHGTVLVVDHCECEDREAGE